MSRNGTLVGPVIRVSNAMVVFTVLALAGCSRVPSEETPVSDEKLVAILKPEGATGTRLFVAQDRKCYFVATGLPLTFSARDYQTMLKARGAELVASGGSAHAPLSVVDTFKFRFIREAAVKPYTVETKEIVDIDPRDRSFFRSLLRMGYSSPIDKSGSTITVRLGPACGEPWTRNVVIPESDAIPLPYGLPRPLHAVITRGVVHCSYGASGSLSATLDPGCQADLILVSSADQGSALDELARSQGNGAIGTDRNGNKSLLFYPSPNSAAYGAGVRSVLVKAEPRLSTGEVYLDAELRQTALPNLPSSFVQLRMLAQGASRAGVNR